jgi:hypothetical protein
MFAETLRHLAVHALHPAHLLVKGLELLMGDEPVVIGVEPWEELADVPTTSSRVITRSDMILVCISAIGGTGRTRCIGTGAAVPGDTPGGVGGAGWANAAGIATTRAAAPTMRSLVMILMPPPQD